MATTKSKTKKKETNVVQMTSREARVLEKFRRGLEDDKDEAFILLLEKILELRNAGMPGPAIAQYLKIGREIIYGHTCQVPAFMLAPELGEVILAARALGLNVSDYILLCHSTWGVGHATRHGNKKFVGDLFALAAGVV